MGASKVLMDAEAIQRAITRMAHEIAERNPGSASVRLVGIQRGGIHLAGRLIKVLQDIWKHPVPLGTLDVSMHRDDVGHRAAPMVHPTTIAFDISSQTVVLVDDVLYRGRTTRVAMDALNDFGRAQCIQLAVLVDRGHRELPIKADFVGKNVPTNVHERINVSLREDGGVEAVLLEIP